MDFLPHGFEWVFLIFVLLLLFGPQNLSKIGRELGKGIRGFKEEMKGISSEKDEESTPKKVDSTPTDEPKK